ncbi:MAG: hypothetical protein R6U31_00355 [bacterium]
MKIVIQARVTSSRLPGKTVERIGSKTVLEWTADACSGVIGDKPVIAIPDTEPNDILEEMYASQYDIYRGSENDVMKRLIRSAKQYDADYILRVCADNPFIQRQFLKELNRYALEDKYDYISFYDGNTNCITKPYGFFGEAFRVNAAEKLYPNTDDFEREHVTPVFYNNPEARNVSIKRITVPESISTRQYLRFTLDNDFDLELYRLIYSNHPRDYYTYNELIEIIESDKTLKEMMMKNKKEGNK